MEVVLLIENDPVWRLAMRRCLAGLPGIEVVEAASFKEAICLVAVEQPGLIIFDLDLNESFDVKAMGNISLPKVSVPMVCLSSEIERYRPLAEKRPGLTLLEKPVSLRSLERIVVDTLGEQITHEPSPFSIIDYVQLACLGQHSVLIEIRNEDGQEAGQLYVQNGVVWAARTARSKGEDAFYELALLDDISFHCQLHPHATRQRQIQTRWEALLIESARRRDERNRTPG